MKRRRDSAFALLSVCMLFLFLDSDLVQADSVYIEEYDTITSLSYPGNSQFRFHFNGYTSGSGTAGHSYTLVSIYKDDIYVGSYSNMKANSCCSQVINYTTHSAAVSTKMQAVTLHELLTSDMEVIDQRTSSSTRYHSAS